MRRHTSHHRSAGPRRKFEWSGFLWKPGRFSVASGNSAKQWNWAVLPAGAMNLGLAAPVLNPAAPEPNSTLVLSELIGQITCVLASSPSSGFYLGVGLIVWPGNADRSDGDVNSASPPPGPVNNPEAPWLLRQATAVAFNGQGDNSATMSTDEDVHFARSKANRKLPEGYGVLIVGEVFNGTDQDSESGEACQMAYQSRFLMKLP